MSASVDLSGHFLMAMPGMVEGDLADTVIYVCEHSDRGALGLVINRPIELSLAGLLEKADLDIEAGHDGDMPPMCRSTSVGRCKPIEVLCCTNQPVSTVRAFRWGKRWP